MQSRLFLYLVFLISLFPITLYSEEPTAQILQTLEQNSLRQKQITLSLWNQYVILDKNLKESKKLTKSLKEKLTQAIEKTSEQEILLRNQASSMTKTYDYSKSLEKDLRRQNFKIKILGISLGISVGALIIGGIYYGLR